MTPNGQADEPITDEQHHRPPLPGRQRAQGRDQGDVIRPGPVDHRLTVVRRIELVGIRHPQLHAQPSHPAAYSPIIFGMSSISELTERVRDFARERDWEQFHTPKNLAMALAGEVGELLAEFQWLTPEQSAAVMADERLGPRVRAELGDVTIYLTRLADVLGIDLVQAALDKLEDSGRRYTVEAARSSATKIGVDHPPGA